MLGYAPYAIVWALFAPPEERAHYTNFVGPPKPEGWNLVGHPNNRDPALRSVPTPTKGPPP
jgi:hypothetical protein